MSEMLSPEQDLRQHWDLFADADQFEGRDTFAERMEAAGFARIRRVKNSDLSEPFAAERGIERGGWLWELTDSGRAALARAKGAS